MKPKHDCDTARKVTTQWSHNWSSSLKILVWPLFSYPMVSQGNLLRAAMPMPGALCSPFPCSSSLPPRRAAGHEAFRVSDVLNVTQNNRREAGMLQCQKAVMNAKNTFVWATVNCSSLWLCQKKHISPTLLSLSCFLLKSLCSSHWRPKHPPRRWLLVMAF